MRSSRMASSAIASPPTKPRTGIGALQPEQHDLAEPLAPIIEATTIHGERHHDRLAEAAAG